MQREELQTQAMQLAGVAARFAFGRRADREERIADAVSTAWEFAQKAGPLATPKSIVYYAIRAVKRGPRRSEFGIDHPRPRTRPPVKRESIDLTDWSHPGDDPADIVQAIMDVATWWLTLNHQQRTVARLYAAGFRTQEIARRLKKTEGRISQIRGRLRESYRELVDG